MSECSNEGGGCSTDDGGATHPVPLQRPLQNQVERGSHLARGNVGKRSEPISAEKLIQDVHRQFKSSISLTAKCAVFEKGDTLLIACSGGLRSLAILKLIRLCNSNEAKYKIHFKYHIVHISGMNELVSDEDLNTLREYVEEEFKEERNLVDFTIVNVNELVDGYSEWSSFLPTTTVTERIDANRFLLKQALEAFARKVGLKYIMLGTDATHLAITALANLALARPNISLLLPHTFSLSGDKSIQFLQPLREVLSTELAHYVYLQKVPVVKFGVFCGGVDLKTKNSVQGITETFIAYLQQNYPSTVFTILRTAAKLSLTDDQSTSDAKLQKAAEEFCVICRENVVDGKYGNEGICMGCLRLRDFYKSDNKQAFRKIQRQQIAEFLMNEEEEEQ